MDGERDLRQLLANLQGHLREQAYVFAALSADAAGPWLADAWALMREDEAVTLVLPLEVAARAGLADHLHWACITLQVHSSLEAVGMIAAVATALAAEGISTNPIAGYYHDHLFVPWERRHDALRILQRLSGEYQL